MTQADNPSGLGMSLDSRPTQGQRQASVDVTTPLPPGWGSFCSVPDPRRENSFGRWYACAPWLVHPLQRAAEGALSKQFSEMLVQTVVAATWIELHAAVADQMDIYETLMGRAWE
ncbi:hypothetical protein OV320_7797 [Actinobacteria bacterium OV320]|nr:hypothetical protein OV320_7797 [Actinobacteria bacterium OV320]